MPSWADVAGPLSPLKPKLPFPATVVIVPAALTLRIRLLPLSVKRKPPSGVAATPQTPEICAAVAGPLSPLKPEFPVPATVVIIPAGETLRIRALLKSAIRKPPSAVAATAVGEWIWAAVAGPPSPLKPAVPVPATVVIIPAAETFRMRSLYMSANRKPPSAVGRRRAEPSSAQPWQVRRHHHPRRSRRPQRC